MTRLASSPPVATKRPSGLNASPMTSSVCFSSTACLDVESAGLVSPSGTPSISALSDRASRPWGRRSSPDPTCSTFSRKPWTWSPISTKAGTDMLTARVCGAAEPVLSLLGAWPASWSASSSWSPSRLGASASSASDGALDDARETGRSSLVVTGCRSTSREPKPQLASQSPSVEKARLQYQSLALGSCTASTSSMTSQMDICMSSPPEARKRLSGDHARHLTPAAHCKLVARSKPRSTSSTATSQFSPPTANRFPPGANTVAWTMSSNSRSVT
mmetsp:Transcript_102688/g.290890  ORF Transcript_102688/g.290890 Transcript_102688/m.290890 type:complete len:274 (-) Transcript_102688:364-1185(-)